MIPSSVLKAVACACVLYAPVSMANYGVPHVERIDSVYDGDTFNATITEWKHIPIIGVDIPIRIVGYDTPEKYSRCDDEESEQREEELAHEARMFTIKALYNAEHISLHDIERDSFFRVDATVMYDGKNLGEELVKAGLAIPEEKGMDTWCDKLP